MQLIQPMTTKGDSVLNKELTKFQSLIKDFGIWIIPLLIRV